MVRAKIRNAIHMGSLPIRRAGAAMGLVPPRLLAAYHGREAFVAKHAPPIQDGGTGEPTQVDRYWGGYTVSAMPFPTARASAHFLEWRFDEHPLFREFAGLWGEHYGEIVLDYGCGPGNDVVGFLIHTDAARVIGMDVSLKALELARRRIALHRVPRSRVQLIHLSDRAPGIPLETDSVDYLQCQGVLQHTSAPLPILRELRRVLKPGHQARVMVYNRESVWFHLYTAYVVMQLEGQHPGKSVEDVFQLTTDGAECPIARCWRDEDFIALCAEAGFDAEFLGGYLSKHELRIVEQHLDQAIRNPRLAPEHREFLAAIEFDEAGLPLHQGRYAGVGGAYVLGSSSSDGPPQPRTASRLVRAEQ